MSFLWICLCVLAYLCGSCCSAILVCRAFHLPDPCTEGSQNPGATNVLRLAGKSYAALVLVVDVLKGYIPVLLAGWMLDAPGMVGVVGLCAVLGHIYPVFFKFAGGKGVATALGVFFGLYWMVGVVALVTWLIVAGIYRYSSLASLVTVGLAPIYALVFTGSWLLFLGLCVMAGLIAYTHRENITRLQAGQESKISFDKK